MTKPHHANPIALCIILTTACSDDTPAGKENEAAEIEAVSADDDDAAQEPEQRSAVAVEADGAFWQLIHDEHQDYTSVIDDLESAFEGDPTDVHLKAHLGWSHFMAFAEGTQRGRVAPSEVPTHLAAALGHFSEAASMAPESGRIRAFLGYTRRAIAFQTGDDALFAEGMADVEASIELWPQFAQFSAFYTLDALTPVEAPTFQAAIEAYWAWQDLCAHEAVDRENPDWSPYASLEVHEGPDRACWNSWIAPHNREGAALIIGDALLKAGETDAAEVMYENATLSASYQSWPQRSLLEQRLEDLEDNAVGFKTPVDLGVPNDPRTTMVSGTRYSCTVCHGGDADQRFSSPPWVLETAHQFLASPR